MCSPNRIIGFALPKIMSRPACNYNSRNVIPNYAHQRRPLQQQEPSSPLYGFSQMLINNGLASRAALAHPWHFLWIPSSWQPRRYRPQNATNCMNLCKELLDLRPCCPASKSENLTERSHSVTSFRAQQPVRSCDTNCWISVLPPSLGGRRGLATLIECSSAL